MTLLLPSILFVVVAVVIMIFGYRRYVMAGRVYENLHRPLHRDRSAVDGRFSIVNLAQFISGKAPASSAASLALQVKLLAAGYRQPNAVAVLYGYKLMMMVAITAAMLAFGFSSDAPPMLRIAGVLIGVMAGFRLPDYFVGRKITRRKKHLRQALPDALDLIIVCAEAGLTIERSFLTVSRQLGFVHRELAEEFSLFTAEVGAGLKRKEALENLAVRTQEPEIRKFAGVLAQADRFGTSMGEALRAHSEYMRVRRRQEAEEKAAKVGVKMIFPIFFFIMPCMMLVTVGPAAIIIVRLLLPALSGKH